MTGALQCVSLKKAVRQGWIRAFGRNLDPELIGTTVRITSFYIIHVKQGFFLCETQSLFPFRVICG
jgi:hypothetical protein